MKDLSSFVHSLGKVMSRLRKREDERYKYLHNLNCELMRRISKAHSQIRALEDRIWSLEGHTLEETIERANGKLDEFVCEVEKWEERRNERS